MITKEELETEIKGCVHFSWKEALFLPRWQVYCIPSAEQYNNIIFLGGKMEEVRFIIGYNIHVTSWLRPKMYNAEVGGAPGSNHLTGMAIDFKCTEKSADEVRSILLPHLNDLKMRMEDLPGSSWVHLDLGPVPKGGKRFFKPGNVKG